MKTRLFITVLYILSFAFAKAQMATVSKDKSFVSTAAEPIIDAIYEFNFSKADSLLKKAQQLNVKDPWVYLSRCNYYWWMIMTGEDNEQMVGSFQKVINETIAICKASNTKNLAHKEQYIILNAYAFRSRLELYRGNYMASAANLNTCLGLLKKSFGQEVKYRPFSLTSSLYNYFVDYAKTNYPVARPIIAMLPEGKMEEGFRLLYSLSKCDDYILNNESNYFLCKIYQETEKQYAKAEYYAAIMVKRYPNNLAYIFNYFDVLLKQGKKQLAMKQLISLNLLSKILPGLTPSQRQFYIASAQKNLKEYYESEGK